jgi:hypothetical protein
VDYDKSLNCDFGPVCKARKRCGGCIPTRLLHCGPMYDFRHGNPSLDAHSEFVLKLATANLSSDTSDRKLQSTWI